MAKRDSLNLILMTHCNVNLQCDDEKLQLRYKCDPNNQGFHVWFLNGENTGLQYTKLIKMLREKYNTIKVTWKRQF